jgi:hypothetical protein
MHEKNKDGSISTHVNVVETSVRLPLFRNPNRVRNRYIQNRAFRLTAEFAEHAERDYCKCGKGNQPLILASGAIRLTDFFWFIR